MKQTYSFNYFKFKYFSSFDAVYLPVPFNFYSFSSCHRVSLAFNEWKCKTRRAEEYIRKTERERERDNLCIRLFFSSLIKFFFLFFIAGDSATQVMRKDEPVFISQSEAFKFAVGDTISLPCEVTQPGKYNICQTY